LLQLSQPLLPLLLGPSSVCLNNGCLEVALKREGREEEKTRWQRSQGLEVTPSGSFFVSFTVNL
jgi:hypothetical protein